MKKSIAAVLVVILMITFAACGKKTNHDAYKEIYKRYNDLESFSATAEIKVKNDRTENIYLVRQYYKAPDNYAMIFDTPESVQNSGYVLKNGEMTLKSGFGQKEQIDVSVLKKNSSVFLVDFLESYYKNEESAAQTSGGFEGETTTLTYYTGGRDKTCFIQRLKFDNETFLPISLETLNVDEKPTVLVIYKDFKRNCNIDESCFD